MTKPQVEEFRAHSALLISVIRDQAGTLWKAILEGLMNLVDAEATDGDVTLTQDRVIIEDNGRGFQSRDEITRCFATFGQPQDEAEAHRKKYGRFRMGRGQLFAYGVNTWRSGAFRMHVDLRKAAGYKIPFDLWDDQEPYPGCRVEIELFQKLSRVEMHEMEEAIRKTARYIDIPVRLNGEQFTKNPAQEKWDFETDEAYIKFRETGNLLIYNQGVLVMELGNWKLGAGGVVVCKVPPRVNFARNDIMSDCPVWKAVRSKINKESTKRNVRSPRLDDGSRQRLAMQLLEGELEDEQARTVKIFTDVTGKHWNMTQLVRFNAQDRIFSDAEMYDSRADKLMQWRLAFVFARETLERFDVETTEELVAVIRRFHRHLPLRTVSYDELVEGIDEHYRLVPQDDWTPQERLVIALLADAQDRLLYAHPQDMETPRRRTIMLGDSDADGWTDGSSFICVTRDFIRKTGSDLRAWAAYGYLLAHEYCHSESTAGSHVHSPEFYRAYHDWTANNRFGDFTAACLVRLPVIAERVGRKLTKRMKARQDQVDRAAAKAAATVAGKT